MSALISLNDLEEPLFDNREVVKKIERKVSGVQKEKSNSLRLLVKGVLGEEEYRETLKRLEAEEEALLREKTKLEEYRESEQERTDNFKLFQEVLRNFDREDIPEARKIFNLIIKKIKVKKP